MKMPEPQKEHQWLEKLVGEWTYEGDAPATPGDPPVKFGGTERVRSLGGFWVIAEGEGDMPGGTKGQTVMTLGFDPDRGRYVGTWVGSMMGTLWVYDGELDAGGRVLTLHSEGPSMTGDGKTARYQDVIEMRSGDHRIFRALVEGTDGTWQQMMTSEYRRQA